MRGLEKRSFGERLKSMLAVDFHRMSKSRLFYILVAIAFVMPIVMTVMMGMMDGTESIDGATGETVIMKGPENAWQNLGVLPGGETMGGSEVFAMCNINMMFMMVAVFVCLFISDDFRSGYAKNLFTVRQNKTDYVISKTTVGFTVGALMLIAYFIGSVLGGAIAGLSFNLRGLRAWNIIACMVSKMFLMLVFVPIFTLISVGARSRAWLGVAGSLGGGMLLFMMVSMITPLGSTFMNVGLTLAGGAMFSIGLGAVSRAVLGKCSLV